jgi:hypothetical protein
MIPPKGWKGREGEDRWRHEGGVDDQDDDASEGERVATTRGRKERDARSVRGVGEGRVEGMKMI